MDTTAIVRAISTPLANSLLSIHPNDVTLQAIPTQWSSWWTWAADAQQPAWLQLLHYFTAVRDPQACQIPIPLRSLIDAVRSLQLERTASDFDTKADGAARSYRISPKKEHEVHRMSAYIHRLVHSDSPRSVWHAVDVGSGQGYLSRALQQSGFHVLALDNNENQTSGANRWATPRRYAPPNAEAHSDSHPDSAQRGSLTHRTVHVCPRTLEESITGWLIDQGHGNNIDDPVPVTLVALHACGSLTVDVIRTFLSHRAQSAKGAWVPHSLVVVGCCYNLMSHSGIYLEICAKHESAEVADFPLSRPLKDLDPVPILTIAAVHLAAQVPAQWIKNDDAMRRAELALRKVVYRALLHPVLRAATTQLNPISDRATLSGRLIQPGLGETLENRRLGKLNDKAYQDWPTFLECATSKLGIDLTAINASFPDWLVLETARLKMERALFALQTLRCILGPLIETLIILDRRDWIHQELAEMNDCGREVEVEMVNLFDQSTGSGRNVALVAKPTSPNKV